MYRIFVTVLLVLLFQSIRAQQDIAYIKGRVIEQNENVGMPLIGANVYWNNTTVGTTTDANGNFKLRELNVEELPFQDTSFDYVVHTLVFCSVVNI